MSGENVAIVLATVAGLARAVGTSRRMRPVVSGAALLAFVVLVRPSPSVLRAAAMGALTVVATLTGRRGSAVPLLAASVLGLVVVDPFLARTPGFVLSVVATAAIVLVAPRMVTRLDRRGWPRPLAIAVAVPTVAQLACTPVLVWVFGQLSPVAIPANVAAAPAVAPVTIVGAACAVSSVAAPPIATALAWLAGMPAGWLAFVARTFAALPGAGLTVPAGWIGEALVVVGVSVAAGAVITVRRRRHAGADRGILATWQQRE